jgi:hypothetical protein
MPKILTMRPRMPGEYGVPKNDDGLLAWSHVQERMTAAQHYWLSTVTPTGEPRSTPVDGCWVEDALLFGGSPSTGWNRNLAKNEAVSVHLPGTTDVVILHGTAPLVMPTRELAVKLAALNKTKYGYNSEPEFYMGGGVRCFRPRVALAWTDFPRDCTRWEIHDTAADS